MRILKGMVMNYSLSFRRSVPQRYHCNEAVASAALRPTHMAKHSGLDLQVLRERCDAGEEFDFLLFWGHTVPKDGKVGKTCLSQWYPAPFTVDGVLYPTAEHYMMAEKARLFNDEEMLVNILNDEKPGQAKKFGRLVQNFDAEMWEANGRRIVTEASWHKFSQNPHLKEYLVSTGEAVIVEASPFDKIWGIGMGMNNAKALDPQTWNGQNLLGFALMDARSMLQEE